MLLYRPKADMLLLQENETYKEKKSKPMNKQLQTNPLLCTCTCINIVCVHNSMKITWVANSINMWKPALCKSCVTPKKVRKVLPLHKGRSPWACLWTHKRNRCVAVSPRVSVFLSGHQFSSCFPLTPCIKYYPFTIVLDTLYLYSLDPLDRRKFIEFLWCRLARTRKNNHQ